MIEVTENFSDDILCPHCVSVLRSLHFRRLRSLFGKRYVYFCPDCKKVLGISHRKGFWMG